MRLLTTMLYVSVLGAALLPVPHDGVAIGYAEVFGFMIHEFLDAIAKARKKNTGKTGKSP